MVNRTDRDAVAIHGTNPQNLIEYNVRKRVYDTLYWKENCFGLSAEKLIDKAMDLNYIGGTYGGSGKPTDFICLILKMLQIQPKKDVIIEIIRNEENKYLRVLGAFYLRLIGRGVDIYHYLEPLYNDYRKIRLLTKQGAFTLIHVDEFIDNLFKKDVVFNTSMPRIQYRHLIEEQGSLSMRATVLEDEFSNAINEVQAQIEEVSAIDRHLMEEVQSIPFTRSRH